MAPQHDLGKPSATARQHHGARSQENDIRFSAEGQKTSLLFNTKRQSLRNIPSCNHKRKATQPNFEDTSKSAYRLRRSATTPQRETTARPHHSATPVQTSPNIGGRKTQRHASETWHANQMPPRRTIPQDDRGWLEGARAICSHHITFFGPALVRVCHHFTLYCFSCFQCRPVLLKTRMRTNNRLDNQRHQRPKHYHYPAGWPGRNPSQNRNQKTSKTLKQGKQKTQNQKRNWGSINSWTQGAVHGARRIFVRWATCYDLKWALTSLVQVLKDRLVASKLAKSEAPSPLFWWREQESLVEAELPNVPYSCWLPHSAHDMLFHHPSQATHLAICQ